MENKKEKKPLLKRWWFWLIVIIIAVAGLSGGSDEDNTKSTEVNQSEKAGDKKDKKNKKKEEEVYKVGDSFETGKLGAKILEAEEKEEFNSDNEFIDSVKTEGKFIVVTAELTNNDEKSRMFSSTMFKIIDDKDREFETLTNADLMMILDDKNLFLEECNPGMSRTGVFVFEVPKDVESYSLKVYSGVGTASKGAVTVKLK